MSIPRASRKNVMHPSLRETISPLFYLLGKLEGRIDEEDRKKLARDLAGSCPKAAKNPGRAKIAASLTHFTPNQPVSVMQVEGEEPVVYYNAKGCPPDIPREIIELGLVDVWEPLFYFQEAFVVLEEYYPLRAAALYLRALTHIWARLIRGRKTEIMADPEFLGLYLEAMRQVENVAAGCVDCPQR